MSTKFTLRNPDSESQTSIIVRTRWKKEQLVYSTGLKLLPSDWNDEKQRVRKSCNTSTEFNSNLEKEISLVKNALAAYSRQYGESPKSKQFKSFLASYRSENSEKQIPTEVDFFDLIEQIITEHQKRLSTEGKSGTHNSVCQAYQQTSKTLKEFESDTRYRINFDSIDLEFYYQFIDWCTETKRFSINNTGKHIKNIKAVMNQALERELTSNTKHRSKKFRKLKEDVENVYLTEDELARLYHLDLSDKPAHRKARDLFLVGAWTGLRISDFKRISQDHIHDDQFGEYISIRTLKTDKVVNVPLLPKVKAILLSYDYKLPRLADQNLNVYIKQVCEMAEITDAAKVEKIVRGKKVIKSVPKYSLVSSHSARRSYATNRYNEGVDSITIMAITGHSTPKQFMTYIKATPKDHLRRIQQHFSKQNQQA